MKQPTEKQLLDIARRHFYSKMPTLKARHYDNFDFYEVSVWNIEAALKEAYELGTKNALSEVIQWAAKNGCPNTAEKAKDHFLSAQKKG